MANLDDKDALLKLQGGDNVLRSIEGLSNQLDQSWQESQAVELPKDFSKANHILVCGMGGSRFPALIIKELFKEKLKVSVDIQDEYRIPAWVDKNTLIILSSYSGTTEEVLHSAKEAQKKGAVMFLGISSGGDVETFLKENKFPVYIFNPTYNPSGQPRIGTGYMLGGLLGFLHKLGFIDIKGEEITNAIASFDELLKNNMVGVPIAENPAKQMAQKLHDRYPYYVVSEFLIGTGKALQNQTNETAKNISSYRIIPELNHHLMEGLKFPEAHKKMAIFVFFYSSFYSEPVQKRFQITKDVVEQNGIETIWCELQGQTKLEQVFEVLGTGGYLTMYLSALYGQDPTVIPYVDYFKKKLKEG